MTAGLLLIRLISGRLPREYVLLSLPSYRRVICVHPVRRTENRSRHTARTHRLTDLPSLLLA